LPKEEGVVEPRESEGSGFRVQGSGLGLGFRWVSPGRARVDRVDVYEIFVTAILDMK
jgi:hypothetical protein